MNITQEEFVRHIEAIKSICDLMETIDDVFARFMEKSREEARFEFPTLIDNVIELLKAATNDKDDLIEWFIWDGDFGANRLDAEINGEKVTLTDAVDLYDLLERMNKA